MKEAMEPKHPNNFETYVAIAEEQMQIVRQGSLNSALSEHIEIVLDNLIEAIKVLGRQYLP